MWSHINMVAIRTTHVTLTCLELMKTMLIAMWYAGGVLAGVVIDCW